MDYFERLLEAGIPADCALETCYLFQTQGDDSGLKRYVQEVEERMNRAEGKECVGIGV